MAQFTAKNNGHLMGKYNVPGPRYTSYPTVPYWDVPPSADQWIDALKSDLGRNPRSGTALYVHIPFCEALCTYCGCNTRITRNHGVGVPYVETVLREWDLYRKALGVDALLISDLHLGGGTPTFLSTQELDTLVSGLLRHCRRADDAEFSLEADPRVTRSDQLKLLRNHGFRRLSLGIQDFDPKVQEVVHRIQSVEQVAQVTQAARDLGYQSISYDLIYGLPFQTLPSIERTLTAVRELRPDRIAFFAYAHVPWIKPSQRRFTEDDLPQGEKKRELYEFGRTLLAEAGYVEVGMDHFALPSDTLHTAMTQGTLHRNFMGYTSQHVSPLIGLGVSAIGDAWTAFSQNEKLLETYQARVSEGKLPMARGHLLTNEDLVLRTHILNLMTRFETDWRSEEAWDPFIDVALSHLKEAISDELVELTGKTCRILPKGKPFVRNICMAFDARLWRKSPTTHIFSQTI